MARRVNASASLLAAAVGLLQAGSALALGLGELRLDSFLNEPLDAEVALLDTRGLVAEDIRIRLAEVEDFDRLGVEREYFLTSIEFDVAVDPATGRGLIRLSTEEPVVEPFLDFIIEARWPAGRLLREYTILIDPPAFREEALTISASERVAEVEGPDPAAAAPDTAEAAQAPGSVTAGEDAVQSGDRVRLLDSDLGPGEMPTRSFSAETVATPSPGSRYMVRRDQNLWQIAREARPDGVSVQQAMLDIQRLNPEAFIDGNINRIKAGYIIYLPSAADISSNDLADALAEVRAQNRAWEEGGRAPPGVTAAATLRISATGDRAEPAAPEDDQPGGTAADTGTAAAAAPGDSAPAPGDGGEGTRGNVAATAPPAQRVEGDGPSAGPSAEVGAQLAAMGERLDALEEMLTVRDAEIARLQAALQDAEAEAARAAAAAAAARAPAPEAAEPAAGGGGGLMPWLYGIGGAIVLALLAVLGLRRFGSGRRPLPALAARTGPEEDDDVFSGVKLQGEPEPETPVAAAPEAAPPQQPEAPPRPDHGERGYGERRYDDYIDDSDDGGDALAEVDIYIAYGRYLQAAELLGSAIRSEPENTAYRLKLMELYVDMGEDDKAREQLEALREHGSADAIERGERLVGGGRGRFATRAAPPPPGPEPEPEFGLDTEAEPGSELEPELDPEDEPGLEPPSVEPPSDEPPVPPPAASSPGGPAPAAEASDGGDRERPEPAPSAAATPEPGERPQQPADDFGERLPRRDAEPEEHASLPAFSLDDAAGEEEELTLDDDALYDDGQVLEEGMEELSIDEEPPVESVEDELDFTAPLSNPVSSDEAVDLGDVPADLGRGADVAADEGSAAEDGNGDGEMVFAEDADQMATRLDLARAYLDMGDDEGARSILVEVARGGNEVQQTEARELLDRLG